ncbi:hypothetical protein MMC18_007516 [Xylographa bjoerkii]|nr:hypothetical protein [Xylographa bjoerkii]
MAQVLHMEGDLDIGCLYSAIRNITSSNRILRSRFKRTAYGASYRTISEVSRVLCILVSEGGEDRCYQELINKYVDLENDQPIAFTLVQTGNDLYEPTVVAHHAILDYSGLNILMDEISKRYGRHLNQNHTMASVSDSCSPPAETAESAIVQRDYVDWATWQESLNVNHLYEFWQQYLAQPPKSTFHPTNDHDIDNQEGRFTTLFSPDLVNAMNVASSRSRISKQEIVLAGTLLALNAIHHISDAVLGIPISLRDEPGTAQLLGLFLDRLPLRLRLPQPTCPLGDLLEAVKSSTVQALANTRPFSTICEAIAPAAFHLDVIVSFHAKHEEPRLEIPGCEVSGRTLRAKGAKFPCMQAFFEGSDGIRMEVEHMVSVLEEEQARTLACGLVEALTLICRRESTDQEMSLGNVQERLRACVTEA